MQSVPDRPQPVMQRDGERRRITVVGVRTDDGSLCTVVVIQETSGAWSWYPHGATKWGYRLTAEVVTGLCQDVLDGPPPAYPDPWTAR